MMTEIIKRVGRQNQGGRNTGVGQSRYTVVRMEKCMQVMITTTALLTQRMPQCNCKPTLAQSCVSCYSFICCK